MERKIKRGDIYYANLNPVIGSEQGGTRPVLIISNDVGNKHSPTVIVAPITSRIHNKAKLPTHTLINDFEGLDKNSSQIAEALGKYLASDVFESYSAGTETKPQINQDAVRIMKELYGIDMETNGQYSKLITDIPDVDIAISMGCNAECPFIGRHFDDNWGLDDPTGKDDVDFIKVIREIEE